MSKWFEREFSTKTKLVRWNMREKEREREEKRERKRERRRKKEKKKGKERKEKIERKEKKGGEGGAVQDFSF